MKPYAVFVQSEVMNQLIQMSAVRRRALSRFLEQLSTDPFLRGEFPVKDVRDRDAEVKLVGSYLVTFYADHAAREIQVLDLEQL